MKNKKQQSKPKKKPMTKAEAAKEEEFANTLRDIFSLQQRL